MMKQTIHGLVIAGMLSGCGGRAANPVMATQYGDKAKSCAALETEMQGIQQEITRLIPQTNKAGENVALGVAGAFFIIPWFFMDFSHAEQEEVNAYRNRYNNLASMAADKGCDIDTRPMVYQTPTAPEIKDKPAYPSQERRRR